MLNKTKGYLFCRTFLSWNIHYQLKIWWSDESTFKVEELQKLVPSGFYAQENLHEKLKIKKGVFQQIFGQQSEVVGKSCTKYWKEDKTPKSILKGWEASFLKWNPILPSFNKTVPVTIIQKRLLSG